MNYRITNSAEADRDLVSFVKSGNKRALKKIKDLMASIVETPYSGIGKPEALKYELSGLWSRRIDRENRLIYEVREEEKIIKIVSLKGHY